MSKKCLAYSESKLGLEPADNRKAFYAGWDAAIKYVLTSDMSEKHVQESDKDRHEHEDDLYDVWVEQGTSQENRQVAMRRTTRDEKIVNPGVYEVPVFDCPRCGHCCQQKEWVGLTDEEVADYWVAAFNENGLYVQTFASLIEAKLKEKNT